MISGKISAYRTPYIIAGLMLLGVVMEALHLTYKKTFFGIGAALCGVIAAVLVILWWPTSTSDDSCECSSQTTTAYMVEVDKSTGKLGGGRTSPLPPPSTQYETKATSKLVGQF